MGKGFHSRSPEEFREYLDSLQKNQKKTFWKQLIIFVDIVLLLLIFFFVYQYIQPGSFSQSQKITVDNFQGLKLGLSASQIGSYNGAFLFLVLDNQSGIDQNLPSPDWTLTYAWRTPDDRLCEERPFQWQTPSRLVTPNTVLVLEIPLPPPQNPELPDCQESQFTGRNWFGIGSLKKRVLHLHLHLRNALGETATFELPLNPYHKNF